MSDVTLADAGHAKAPATKMSKICAVHRHDEWIPENEHHIWPVGMGGPNIAANKITVCANGHYMIHEYIRQLILHNGDVPSSVKIHFGYKVREYARIGWEKAGSPSRGTVGE